MKEVFVPTAKQLQINCRSTAAVDLQLISCATRAAFRGSPLIETDATDREALKAASKLTELATELSSSGADAPLLSQAEQQQFNRILLRKLWEKRAELQLVSRRLAATLLDQTVQRVLTPRNSV